MWHALQREAARENHPHQGRGMPRPGKMCSLRVPSCSSRDHREPANLRLHCGNLPEPRLARCTPCLPSLLGCCNGSPGLWEEALLPYLLCGSWKIRERHLGISPHFCFCFYQQPRKPQPSHVFPLSGGQTLLQVLGSNILILLLLITLALLFLGSEKNSAMSKPTQPGSDRVGM